MITLWKGIFAALWSPTDADGRLLEREFTSSLRFIFENGVHGAMAFGSTGEFLFLDLPTKQRLLELALENAGGRPVIANVSHLNAGHMHALSAFARKTGAAAVALLPPYFYPVAQPDLVDFFARAADWAELPILLYNFPERAGNRIDLETIAAVADRVRLAGVKQSGAEFAYHGELVQLGKEKGFAVLTGSDTRLAEAMALGVTGCIGGLAGGVPDLMMSLYDSIQTADENRVQALTARVSRIGLLLNEVDFPLNVAALIEARGLPVGAPKRPVSTATAQRYRKIVAEGRALLQEWQLIK